MASFISLFLLLVPSIQTSAAAARPEYSIEAIRFGTIPQFRTAGLVVGADPNERLDIATIIWLIRGGGRTILFDTTTWVPLTSRAASLAGNWRTC